MDFVWSTAAKDLRRLGRDRVALATWIGIPFVVGLLITTAFGGSGGPTPTAHVLIVDEDDNFLSRLLVGALSQDAAGGLVDAEEVELDDGLPRIEKGEATALLVIPEGFAEAVFREEPAELRLLTNPSQSILPGIVEEMLSIFVDGTFYLHRLIGDELQRFADGPDSGTTFPDEQIAEFSVTVNQIVDQLSRYLNPLVIELETAGDEAEEDEEEPSLALLFLPGLLFMSLLFMAQGISNDLWQEQEQRTLRRMAVSPRSTASFLAGKILAGAALVAVVSVLALAAGYRVFALDWASWPLAVVWTVFSGAVLTSGMMVIQLHASSHRAGNVLTMLIVFPLMMIGGSFFPFESMGSLADIGRLTPNGWALSQLKAILHDRVEPGSLAVAFLALSGTGALFFAWSGHRLRTRFARS